MTERKNQHFVPQFYLKNFSNHLDRKTIGLFNPKSNIFVKSTLIKNQSCVDFFYGQDGILEEGLSQIENILAPIIADVTTNKILPKNKSEEHIALLVFIILSDLRNLAQVDDLKLLPSLVNREINRNSKGENLKYMPETSHEVAIELAFKNFPVLLPTCMDLDFKLLQSANDSTFITGDFPIIKYNSFLEKKVLHTSSNGYAALGLLIFLPLSPEITLIFYDPNIYKLGTRKQKIVKATTKDVEQLNLLQLLNCTHNVYFNHQQNERGIINLAEKSSILNVEKNMTAESYKVIREGEIKENEQIIHFKGRDYSTNLDLSFLKLIRKANGIDLRNNDIPLRPKAESVFKQWENRFSNH